MPLQRVPGSRSPLRIPRGRSVQLFVLAHAVAAGAFWLQVLGGAWDIESHLARRPEFFWTPPHVVLYAGIGLAFAACANGLLFGRARGAVSRSLRAGLRFAFVAGLVQFAAGAFDSWWHETFGPDNALSPPHVLMILGMNLVGIGLVRGFTDLRRDPDAARASGRLHAIVLGGATPFAYTGLAFALLGLAWVFSHPGFDADPLLAQTWQRGTVALVFSAFLPLVALTARGLWRETWGATAVLTLTGLSLATLPLLMGRVDALTLLSLPAFVAAGFLADRLPHATRRPIDTAVALAVIGLAMGALAPLFLREPTEGMTGALAAFPPSFFSAYLLGGLLGAFAGSRLHAWILPETKAILPRPTVDGSR